MDRNIPISKSVGEPGKNQTDMTKIRTTTVRANGGINCKQMDVQLPELLMTERSSSVFKGESSGHCGRRKRISGEILLKLPYVMDIAQVLWGYGYCPEMMGFICCMCNM
jgi:hypothetical protein